jgi:hypothetical protein
MPFGVILGPGRVASHHRDERRAIGFLKAGTTFHLGHVTAANDSPANSFAHNQLFMKPLSLLIRQQVCAGIV